MTNQDLTRLLDAFLRKHPWLEPKVCSDQGIRLMNIDGRIAERLINVYTAANIPILSVHDSFIVPYDQTKRLQSAMRNAALGVVGRKLDLDSDETGLDILQEKASPEVVLDFIRWRQLARSKGYLQRLKRHEETVGKKVEELREEYWDETKGQ